MLNIGRLQFLKPARKIELVARAAYPSITKATLQNQPQVPNRHRPLFEKSTDRIQELHMRRIEPEARVSVDNQRQRLDTFQRRHEFF
jgi:hypothetical protein